MILVPSEFAERIHAWAQVRCVPEALWCGEHQPAALARVDGLVESLA